MKTIEEEKQEAYEKYGHFNSTHEVYGVLMEEVEEFWELVRMKPIDDAGIFELSKEGKLKAMIAELTQIAAIAERTINELENNKIKWT